MSGGHWGYLQNRFDEAADRPDLARSSLRLLGQIEHELDWGHSGDTCLECARLRVMAALEQFYDDSGCEVGALAVLRDREAVETYCDGCLSRMHTWGRQADARPTLAERDREVARRAAIRRD